MIPQYRDIFNILHTPTTKIDFVRLYKDDLYFFTFQTRNFPHQKVAVSVSLSFFFSDITRQTLFTSCVAEMATRAKSGALHVLKLLCSSSL